jgi:hypothetical protein
VTNRWVERVHRQLKDALPSQLAGVDWLYHQPWVLLGLRAAPKEDSGVSSAELANGAPLTLPGQFLSAEEPPPFDFVELIRSASLPLENRLPTYGGQTSCCLDGGEICVRLLRWDIPPLEPLYPGQNQVLGKGSKVFRLAMGGEEESFLLDRSWEFSLV